ncbi:MAG: hypothetical protein GY850_32840 [bacterium]|nr:hypothetical protein [bacterium]
MKKFWVTFVLLTGAVLLFLGALSPHAASAGFRRLACGNFVSGSYLATITNENTGEFASRSLITFFFDHNMSVVDSAEGGGAADFSDQQGEWKCTGRREIAATTLDFAFPDAGLARLDYEAAFAGQGAKAQKVEGTVKLNLFSNPMADPFSDDVDLVQKFTFTGQRVTAD